jgi:hypothetical protein
MVNNVKNIYTNDKLNGEYLGWYEKLSTMYKIFNNM